MQKALTGRISARGRALTLGDLLAQWLNPTMAGHFIKLTAFTNEFCRDVVDAAKLRSSKAWMLAGQCVACVF